MSAACLPAACLPAACCVAAYTAGSAAAQHQCVWALPVWVCISACMPACRLSVWPMQASSATGSYLGAVVFETLAGIQCDTPSGLPLLGDWPGVFYLQGVCGMCVAAVWWRCVRDTPGQHRYCSDEERRLIASRYDRPLFIKTNSTQSNSSQTQSFSSALTQRLRNCQH